VSMLAQGADNGDGEVFEHFTPASFHSLVKGYQRPGEKIGILRLRITLLRSIMLRSE